MLLYELPRNDLPNADCVPSVGHMHFQPTLIALALCTLAATAQTSKSALPLPAGVTTSGFSLPNFDAARITFRETGDLDLDGGAGSVEITQLEVRSALSRPLRLANDWLVVPMAEFTLTTLSLNDNPAGVPLHDEDLYSLGLSAFAIHMSDSSPWLYGGWARAELASDFEHITSDALSFDLAAGAGYRFNDRFLLGLGAAVCNLNGNVTFYPGIGFDWIVNDDVRVGLYGPSFIASYAYSKDWLFSFRTKANGGIWNIADASGGSHAIDLTCYQLGLFADRRLTDQLWLSGGVGMVVANKLEYATIHGDTLFERDVDSGLFGQIGLRFKTW